MLRAVLTLVLMSIGALPNGVCFCHYLDAAAPIESNCCETQLPTDDRDDHDDCPCQLREVLVASPAPLSVERDDSSACAVVLSVIDRGDAAALVQDQSNHSPAFDGPLPRMLCALRI